MRPTVGQKVHVSLHKREICGTVMRLMGLRVGVLDSAGQVRWFLLEECTPCDCGTPLKGA